MRPNILLMHCHDLGRFLGCYGIPTINSPNLDGLAADGVRFTNAFCTAPQCSPSRASLFTGRYPHNNGVLGLTHSDFAWDLDADETHLAQRLKDAGYATAAIGVVHEARTRDRLGFDKLQPGGHADEVADKTIDALRTDGPFYLQVGFTEPHRLPGKADPPGTMGFLGDYIEPDDSKGVTVPGYLVDTDGTRAELAELQGAVRHMDAAVGRILAHVPDNTIVIFTTDHGVALPRAKCSLYDPGIETALIIRSPENGWTGGRTVDELVSNVDVVPTLLDILDLDAPDHLQGRSFAAALNDQPHDRRTEIFAEMTYHDYYDPRRCIRTETHKLIANFSSAPAFMDPSQSWQPRSTSQAKHSGRGGYHPFVECYDLGADPHELTNIAEDPIARGLMQQLHQWMVDTDDPLLAGAVTSPLHRRTVAALSEACE